METALNFFRTHLLLIIEVLIVAICVVGAFWLVLGFFRKDAREASTSDSGADLSAIEETLKKVLANTKIETTTSAPVDAVASEEGSVKSEFEESAAPQVAAAAVAAPGPSDDEIKEMVAEKDGLIDALKSKVAELESAPASSDNEAIVLDLKSKINDLEGKLAEYEIIEDDIADLSSYKEENTRLKEQIEALKSEAAPGPEPTAPEAPVAGEEVVEEAVPEAAPEVTAEEALEVEADPEEVTEEGLAEDDLVAEFETAVNQQKESKAEEAEVVEPEPELAAESPKPEPAVAAIDTSPKLDDGDIEGGGDDIFSEFEPSDDGLTDTQAAAMEINSEDSEAAEDSTDEEVIDTEKMLSEMEGLADMVVSGEESSVLEEEMDVDKMAAEATKLASGDNN